MPVLALLCAAPGCTSLLGSFEKVDDVDAASEVAADAGAEVEFVDSTALDSTALDSTALDTTAPDSNAPDSSMPIDTGSDADSGVIDSSVIDSSVKDTTPDTAPLDCSGAATDAGPASTPPSCAGGGAGRSTCGPTFDGDCCASTLVPGGSFLRSYDSITHLDASHPATVSSFRLDNYEVTVARFRKFVAALAAGWTPDDGGGKHKHLHCGLGLALSGGGFETGWLGGWNSYIPSLASKWDGTDYLACDSKFATWQPAAGNDSLPINCVNLYQATAFCIWDGGFLPSEAEWNYAAAGGSEQRKFPWGNSSPSADTNRAIYGCYYNATGTCTGLTNIATVGRVLAGKGLFGQYDLAGSVWEWTIDGKAVPYGDTSCVDCAFPPTTERMFRGGSFQNDQTLMMTAARSSFGAGVRNAGVGFRCARMP